MRVLMTLALATICFVSQPSFAGTKEITTKVTATRVGATLGGCGVKFSGRPNFAGCTSFFAQMGCDGSTSNSQVAAYRMLDSAQMSMALNKNVKVLLNNASGQKRGGACLVQYIQVVK